MYLYALIILLTFLVLFLLEIYSNYLNILASQQALPSKLSSIYEEKQYLKSQNYLRTNTKFSLLTESYDLAILLSFWFLGGFNQLDIWIRSFGYGEIVTGCLYIGVLVLAKMLFSLPFSIYKTFVIEEKFGFNKTTPTVFVSDLVKGLLLGILIGLPLLAGIIYFFETFGNWAWLYVWIGISLFSFLLQYIAPTWIMPLFNKFMPLDESNSLKQRLLEYASKVGFPLDNVFVIDGSKRSTKSNAFFTGFGKNRRVALFDTLIENHSNEELLAVVAHEIGHYKKKHILQGTILGIIQTGILLIGLQVCLTQEGLFEAFYMDTASVYTGLIFFSLLFSPIEFLVSLFLNAYSRKNEYEADRFAVETTSDPKPLVNALKKLSSENLTNLTPHPLYVTLNYSHPPLLTRIEAIEKIKIKPFKPA